MRGSDLLRSWKLGTLGGVEIYAHSTCVVLLVAQLVQPMVAGGWGPAAYRLALILAVLGCIVLHELGHAWMARQYGIGTRDITLYPIGGVASLERMSEEPREEFWIAVAGPAVTTVIVAMLRLPTLILPEWFPSRTTASFLPGCFVFDLALINLALLLFNLVPAFPMDGGRALRAILSVSLGRLRATKIAAGLGAGFALLFGLAGAFSGQILLVLVAAFVYFVGKRELANVQHDELLRQIPAVEVFQSEMEIPNTAKAAGPKSGTLTWEESARVWVFWENGRPVHKFRAR
jgi:Zn-dependent protease